MKRAGSLADGSEDDWGDGANVSRRRAHRIFRLLDLDGDTRLSSWELSRYLSYVLGAKPEQFFDVQLPSPEIGIEWAIDSGEDGDGEDVVVAAVRAGSLAAEWPAVRPGLRLLFLNGHNIGTAAGAAGGGVKQIAALLDELDETDAVSLRFLNPFAVVTDANAWLDLSVLDDDSAAVA
ncbi:unnamed protein product, partial [Phaeothamnion confervicola]